ncbi:MAG: hypothetical protein ABIT71_07080 [Vicinamibacteraceae bacterium]
MIDPARATWLAFLSVASAWAAGVAGLAVLPLSAAAFAVGAISGAPAAATLAGWLGVIIGLGAIGYAIAASAVARSLWRGGRWARGGALGLAFANLFIPPFGTAHGVYALWLLLAAPRPHDHLSEVTHEHE